MGQPGKPQSKGVGMTYVLSKNIDRFGWISDDEADVQINEIVSYFPENAQSSFFVGLAVWESMGPNLTLHRLVERLKQQNVKIILIFESSQDQSWLEPILPYCKEVLFIPFWLYITYHHLVAKNPQQLNLNWNPSATKILYLTGTLRHSRARMFYKLYVEGLLDHTIWSLFVPANPEWVDPDWIPEIDPDKVFDFLKKYESTPDDQPTIIHDDGTKTVMNFLRSDPRVHRQSRFRLVTETSADESFSPSLPRITEKTWFAIANHLPFMILGRKKSLATLKNFGMKTFENYLPISDYDLSNSVNERIDALIVNSRHWLSEDLPIDEINQDIEHNYQQFIMIAIQTNERLENLIGKYNLGISREDLLPSAHNLHP